MQYQWVSLSEWSEIYLLLHVKMIKQQIQNLRLTKATYWIFPEVHLSDILAALFQVAFKDEDLETLAFTLKKYWAKNRPFECDALLCKLRKYPA